LSFSDYLIIFSFILLIFAFLFRARALRPFYFSSSAIFFFAADFHDIFFFFFAFFYFRLANMPISIIIASSFQLSAFPSSFSFFAFSLSSFATLSMISFFALSFFFSIAATLSIDAYVDASIAASLSYGIDIHFLHVFAFSIFLADFRHDAEPHAAFRCRCRWFSPLLPTDDAIAAAVIFRFSLRFRHFSLSAFFRHAFFFRLLRWLIFRYYAISPLRRRHFRQLTPLPVFFAAMPRHAVFACFHCR
jgi:hypothetical protein